MIPNENAERRPLYWSVRRELWENRSIYIAPIIVASVALFGFMISMFFLPHRMRTVSALPMEKQTVAAVMPFSMVASMILFTGFIVALFYCLDALNSERRDRSILFWKSMPVSDVTTVLAKACIPFAVVPLVTCTIALVTQAFMLVVSTFVLTVSGVGPAILWSRLPMFQMPLIMLYGVVVHVLWFAPIYGWFLLVSALVKRAMIVWAVLPFVAIGIIEKLSFGTNYWSTMIRYRLMGAMQEGFEKHAANGLITSLSQLRPLNFLLTPGLWVGLIVAALSLWFAVRLRRNREPL